jgi:hypothetical protein
VKHFCKKHKAPAGWHCPACGAYLCPEDVALKSVHFHTSLTVCLECGELPELLTVHRSEEKSYVQRLVLAPVWPLQPQGLMFMAAVGVVRAVLSYAPIGLALGGCVLAAACFALLRASSRGSGEFEPFDSTDLIGDLIAPAVKALVAFFIAFAPAAAYAYLRWPHEGTSPLTLLLQPPLWLLLAVGVAYAPMAMMIGAAGGSITAMLNPLAMTGGALRLGGNYFVAVGALVLLAIPWILFMGLGTLLEAIPIPFVPRVLDYFLACYVPFVSVRVLGLLLYTHGDAVGYGVDHDYRKPLIGDAQPRGVLPEPAAVSEAPKVDKYAPIELPPDDAAPVQEPARERLRELDPSALPPLKTEE